MRAVIAAGVDGCRAGWLYAAQDLRTGRCRVGVLSRIGEILLLDPAPAVIAIDIPIGLTDQGPRACDQEARRLLGRPRSSSVFPAPIRRMLDAEGYARACAIGRRTDGRAINRETWNIIPKIREADSLLGAHPELRAKVHEAHPELSFFRWNGRRAMAHGKRTEEGRAERRTLIASQFRGCTEAAAGRLPRGGWAQDDLLDAFALLWTARRIARGTAVTIPVEAPVDSLGVPMRIVS